IRYEGEPVVEADPTGAGDAFDGVFLAALATGASPGEALRGACAPGARAPAWRARPPAGGPSAGRGPRAPGGPPAPTCGPPPDDRPDPDLEGGGRGPRRRPARRRPGDERPGAGPAGSAEPRSRPHHGRRHPRDGRRARL